MIAYNAVYRNSCAPEDALKLDAWLFKRLVEGMYFYLQIPVLRNPAIFYNSVQSPDNKQKSVVPGT